MAVVKNIIGGAIDFVADAVGGAFSIVAGIAGEIIGSLLDIPDVDSQAKDDQTLSVSALVTKQGHRLALCLRCQMLTIHL